MKWKSFFYRLKWVKYNRKVVKYNRKNIAVKIIVFTFAALKNFEYFVVYNAKERNLKQKFCKTKEKKRQTL
jgi:hypothetical protein